MFELVEKYAGFMGSTDDYSRAGIVLVGAPMDLTVSFRSGTRQGPQQVRRVSYSIEEYSVELNRDLSDYCYFDAGDIIMPFGSVRQSLQRVEQVVAKVLNDGRFPLILGGEHLISLPVIREMVKVYPDLIVVQLDAHADLRDEYMGETCSHATVMRRVAEIIGSRNLYQFGIRSGSREEFDFARANTNIFINEVVSPLQKVLAQLKNRPVYLSLDIDVLDPAYAPGTGSPEPGGCSVLEILKAIYILGELQVVGLDLVEVNPVYDLSERTALLAAKLVREAIISFGLPVNQAGP
jgi:agmatinase